MAMQRGAALAALDRYGNGLEARQVAAGERGGVGLDLRRRALRNHLATVHPGSRAQVDHMIGAADRVLVMLHDDDGIPQVTQPVQRAQQPLVVALVQADGRLVEDVHHAGEARADLAREPDALGLTARERIGGAIEPEVVEADVGQEAEPLHDFAHDAFRHRRTPPGQVQGFEVRQRVTDGKAAELRDVAAVDQHRARGRIQSRAAAIRARPLAAVPAQFLAHRAGIRSRASGARGWA